jgi:hypothetical protein
VGFFCGFRRVFGSSFEFDVGSKVFDGVEVHLRSFDAVYCPLLVDNGFRAENLAEELFRELRFRELNYENLALFGTFDVGSFVVDEMRRFRPRFL